MSQVRGVGCLSYLYRSLCTNVELTVRVHRDSVDYTVHRLSSVHRLSTGWTIHVVRSRWTAQTSGGHGGERTAPMRSRWTAQTSGGHGGERTAPIEATVGGTDLGRSGGHGGERAAPIEATVDGTDLGRSRWGADGTH